jgi:hypothetical protein
MAVAECVLRIREDIFDRPVFVLTADVDWASDYCIDALASFANARGIKPTLFVTHDSAAIAALRQQGHVELGIHPDFLAGSGHGSEPGAVIANLMSIVPEPVAVRSHRYAENSDICRMLVAKGLCVDCNVCLFLQPALKPLHHWSGLLRLPCFWEDDIHVRRGFSWDFAPLRKLFLTPGLKLLNLHPFMFALNIPDAASFANNRHLIRTLDAPSATRLRHADRGPATFLTELIGTVHSEGLGFTTIGDLVKDLRIEWISPSSNS